MWKQVNILLLIEIILVYLTVGLMAKKTDCPYSNGEPASCVTIRKCKQFAKPNLTRAEILVINNSRCQKNNGKKGICCAESLITATSIIVPNNNNNCRNLFGMDGSCVRISQCSITKNKRLNRTQFLYKRKYSCSEHKEMIKYVCCPKNEIISNYSVSSALSCQSQNGSCESRENCLENQIIENVSQCNRNQVCCSKTNHGRRKKEQNKPCELLGERGKCISRQNCLNIWPTLRDKLSDDLCDDGHVCCIPPKSTNSKHKENKNTVSKLKYLLPSTCGTDIGEDRISYGNRINLREFPWMALLVMPKGDGTYESICSGSLIHEEYILTSAHCLKNNISSIIVRLGEYDTSSEIDCNDKKTFCAPPTQNFHIMETIIHQQYNIDSFENDIALIKLSSPCIFSDYVKPICLPLQPEPKDFNDMTVYISGWGLTEFNMSSNFKLKAEVNIESNANCKKFFKGYLKHNLSYSYMCHKGHSDTCKGDSGSPLMFRDDSNTTRPSFFVCVGVTSSGNFKCGTPFSRGISIRTSAYLWWILQQIWQRE